MEKFGKSIRYVGSISRSTVWKGREYEIGAQRALSKFGFRMVRVGGARDGGVDLAGTWRLKQEKRKGYVCKMELKSIVQCKLTGKAEKQLKPEEITWGEKGKGRKDKLTRRVGPESVRELEGVISRITWNCRQCKMYSEENDGINDGKSVLGILVSSERMTRGVQEAITRSSWPLAFMMIDGERHEIYQMVWNERAAIIGLEVFNLSVQCLYDGELSQEVNRGGIGEELVGRKRVTLMVNDDVYSSEKHSWEVEEEEDVTWATS